jgi:hypothetical protein
MAERRNPGLFPEEERYFCLLQNVHKVSGAYPGYPVDTGDPSMTVKRPGMKLAITLLLRQRLRMSGAIPSF